jgi:uncharacterized protein YjbJ (UPF0337 family)
MDSRHAAVKAHIARAEASNGSEVTMKTLSWILAGVGAGAILAYVVLNQPRLQAENGWDSVENAARRTTRWGSKSRLSGMGSKVTGKLKEGFGRATGDTNLADEGVGDQAIGAVKDAVGTVAQVAGETLHDMNR